MPRHGDYQLRQVTGLKYARTREQLVESVHHKNISLRIIHWPHLPLGTCKAYTDRPCLLPWFYTFFGASLSLLGYQHSIIFQQISGWITFGHTIPLGYSFAISFIALSMRFLFWKVPGQPFSPASTQRHIQATRDPLIYRLSLSSIRLKEARC